ncbi:hypothetical protein [Natronomonas sp.]|uniref:hypothetical protein n=1 Tax=Natronomonas sp. TaxID=2184060 RepID=UPI00262C43D3|nr:hypothetical protein [Natronomonas sp.]
MCHGYTPRDRTRTDEASEEDPSFLNEESSVDTELLTDGGDEDTDEVDEEA